MITALVIFALIVIVLLTFAVGFMAGNLYGGWLLNRGPQNALKEQPPATKLAQEETEEERKKRIQAEKSRTYFNNFLAYNGKPQKQIDTNDD